MSKIFITGISGLIGSRIANQLCLDGENIVGSGRKDLTFKNKKIKYYKLDLNNKNDLENIFKENNISSIIHLASPTDHSSFSNNKNETLKMNLNAIYNLVDVALKYNVKKIIYSSSGKVYGEMKNKSISEDDALEPKNNLGKIKKLSEDALKILTNESGICLVIARIFNVYGPKQKNTFVIPHILRQLYNDEILLGNLEDARDYIFVDDAASALFLLNSKDLPIKTNIFNIGSSKSNTVNDILKIIEGYIKSNLNIKRVESRMRSDENSNEVSNIKKIIKLGWKPKFSLEEGLKVCIKNFTYKKK